MGFFEQLIKLARGDIIRAGRHARRYEELNKLRVEKDDRGRAELEARAKKAEESLAEFNRSKEAKEHFLLTEINDLKKALSGKESELANYKMQATLSKSHFDSFAEAR